MKAALQRSVLLVRPFLFVAEECLMEEREDVTLAGGPDKGNPPAQAVADAEKEPETVGPDDSATPPVEEVPEPEAMPAVDWREKCLGHVRRLKASTDEALRLKRENEELQSRLQTVEQAPPRVEQPQVGSVPSVQDITEAMIAGDYERAEVLRDQRTQGLHGAVLAKQQADTLVWQQVRKQVGQERFDDPAYQRQVEQALRSNPILTRTTEGQALACMIVAGLGPPIAPSTTTPTVPGKPRVSAESIPNPTARPRQPERKAIVPHGEKTLIQKGFGLSAKEVEELEADLAKEKGA